MSLRTKTAEYWAYDVETTKHPSGRHKDRYLPFPDQEHVVEGLGFLVPADCSLAVTLPTDTSVEIF